MLLDGKTIMPGISLSDFIRNIVLTAPEKPIITPMLISALYGSVF